MSTTVQINLIDRSAERTSLRVPTVDLASGSIAVIEALETALIDGVNDLSLLPVVSSSVNEITKGNYVLPSDENAVRELAVRFIMADINQNQAAFSLGGPDLTKFPFTTGPGGDIYEWGSGTPVQALEDFVGAVTTAARHPISGLGMTMKRLELVGRSN